MIKFSCPECGHGMKVPDEAAGKRGKCKKCGETVQVPKSQKAEIITQPPPMDFDEAPLPSRRRKRPTHREASPVSVEIHQEKPVTNSLGIAALVLGIIALLLCWIPFINLITALPLGGIGLILSLIGLVMAITRKGTGIGYPIAAGTLNFIAVLVPIIMTAFFTAAAGTAVSAIDEAGKEIERRESERNKPLTTNADGEATEETEVTDTTEEPNTEPASPWDNASAIYDGELVKVEITGAKIGKVDLKTFSGESTSEDDFLIFTINITNKQEAKKMDFRGWKAETFDDRAATLEDEHSNQYHGARFSSASRVQGQAAYESIYPQKSVGDVLPFEVPVDAAKELRLKLPAAAYGEEGQIHLIYDAGEVER
ncbi:hypothetical protein Pla110_24420 [Polystyrenella longa]|uniref:Telomeric repeat-binding factor 2 n=1 Tax=Polystyrenella longa TaxID=2528007 RepID=A0A518CNA7_9PLAN|nr:hypothetical protein [Polystyrenella longa]QDU80710.1 hypothetical protein Pla110_24420 [Polystyrenella longa]